MPCSTRADKYERLALGSIGASRCPSGKKSYSSPWHVRKSGIHLITRPYMLHFTKISLLAFAELGHQEAT